MYEHFTTECFDNIDAGTALCLATGDYTASGGTKGTLSGHMSYYYTIQQRSLTSANSEGLSDFDIKIDGDDFAYTGEAITPSVTVVDNRLSEDADPARKNLQEGVDYYLTYAENTDPGTAVIYITGMGNYCDTIKLNFNIKEDANNVCYYVKFANALDSSVTVHSSIKIDGCSDGETVKVNVNDLISSQDCASDFDEFNQKYYLQDDQEKELTLDVHAKNVITFKFLPIGVTMPVVEDVQIEKVNKINDVYLKATVYPLSISQSVTWSSLDPEIAKIDPVTGKVEFIKDGVVEFVATSDYDGQSAATFMLSYSEENSILDPSTGISVTGLPDGINLEIETLDKSSDYYSRLSYYDKLFSLFNIKLYSVNSANEKVEVQPACPLKVSVPLTFDPTTLENDLLFIYHYYEGDSKYERLEYEVNETNNTLDFVLNSCSRIEIFGPIVEKATELPLDPSEDDGYQSWINGWLTGDTDSVAIYDVIDEAQDNNSKNLKVAVDADFEDESTVPEAEQNVLANEAITEESSVKNNRYDDDSAKQNLATTAEDLKSDSNNLKNLIPALLCISALLLGVLYVFANSKKKRRVEI
jgi:hypothetical protein